MSNKYQMFSRLQLKLLQHLSVTKNNKGLTLLELLVVVVIVGILSVISIPNFLNQVNKAREVEGQNGIGTLVRSQKIHHFETGEYVTLTNNQIQLNNALGITIESKYYEFNVRAINVSNINILNSAVLTSNPSSNYSDQMRNYVATLFYYNGKYYSKLCQSLRPNVTASTPILAVSNNSVMINCNTNNSREIK